MDEKLVLTHQQIFNSGLKASKCRSLVKRRFQSLGLKYADSLEVRDRLTKIEKNALISLGKFCQSNDITHLNSMAMALSDLFLLKGELITTDNFGDRETSYWSVPQGSCNEWIQSLTTSEYVKRQFTDFRLTFDSSEERTQLVKKNARILGCYLLPYFVDLNLTAGAFINLPSTVNFKQVQRIRPQIRPETTHDHIVTIEDSPFLSRLKFKLIATIDQLPDANEVYSNTFNSIVDRALLSQLKKEQEQIDSPSVCKNVLSGFADSILSLPVFNIGFNDQYRNWTPWSINFVEFCRQAAKVRTSVYVPEAGQVKWKSQDHKELAEICLINQIIPKQYHWLLGVPTMWRNNFRDHDQRITLFREWRESNGCG